MTRPAPYVPTEQEIGVIELIADGFTYTSIARRLKLTDDTVKTIVIKLFRRANVNAQAALVDWAWFNGHLGDRLELRDDNEELRRRLKALDPAGDRAELLAQVKSLTNQVENLRDMYRTAVNFRGWQPTPWEQR